jgi:pilus assembly protein CpaB
MKNTKALAMIIVSVALALAAVWFAQRWMVEQNAMGTNKVAVAAQDIEIGTRLTQQMVSMTNWPASSIPAGAVTDGGKLVDRVVKASILRSEPILESKLAPEGTKGGLSAIVAQGKRAMTVKVNEVIGVAGFALPGNYVDVIVNTQEEGTGRPGSGDRTDQSVSKIVLEKILVLAVAQEANRDETKPRKVEAVTLELTPEQTETLDLARSVGTLSLVLRNQVDPQPVQTTGATKETLLGTTRVRVPTPKPALAAAPATTAPKPATRGTGRKAAEMPKVAAAPPRCVTVITGTKDGTEVSRECF